MSKRRFRELKEKTSEDLQKALKTTMTVLFDAKMDQQMGRPFVSGDFWKWRKDIAMIRTIQTQRAREQV